MKRSRRYSTVNRNMRSRVLNASKNLEQGQSVKRNTVKIRATTLRKMNDADRTMPLSFEGKGGNALAMYLARQNYKAALIGRESLRESEQWMRLAADGSNPGI